MFRIKITALPSSRFGSDEPEVLSEPFTFAGFRTRTGRRDASTYGTGPRAAEVTYAGGRGDRKPATWTSREAAERNLARLTERGYVATVEEV